MPCASDPDAVDRRDGRRTTDLGPGSARADLAAAQRAAAQLVDQLGGRPDSAVVLGTGLTTAADLLGETIGELAMADIGGPGFLGAPGHRARLRLVRAGDRRILLLLGRAHLYEGRRAGEVVHPVRTAVLAGCRTVVLTNAAGAIRRDLGIGDVVLIADHLDLTGSPSALVGLTPAGSDDADDEAPAPPTPFVDLTDAWSPRLRAQALTAAPGTATGVYAQLRGPEFETPAQIRMLAALGADLVGMSTVVEAVAARHLGAELLGLSVVTNTAAGLGEPVSAAAVAEVATRAATQVAGLVSSVLESDGPQPTDAG